MVTMISLALAVVLSSPGQENPFAPPAEIEHLKYMVGEWTSEGTSMGPDGAPVKMSGKVTCKLSMDRWIEWDTHDTITEFGELKGKLMVTFDSKKNKWEGIWFDNISGYALRSFADLKGSNLNFMSEEAPGMDGSPTHYRITFTKINDRKLTTKIESKMGTEYVTMLDYTSTKK